MPQKIKKICSKCGNSSLVLDEDRPIICWFCYQKEKAIVVMEKSLGKPLETDRPIPIKDKKLQ